ncbi:MT-A70 family methyltransferase [Simplicispira lacusdiani]|uniref:MT-A70 family methyltransferase n=1 Tax=Simplicispira lacusdiani TaxID=2213010 RepID=UPI000E72EA11|nr:MT-A70 family methyltransferase [Simplicispira lacusdiani]
MKNTKHKAAHENVSVSYAENDQAAAPKVEIHPAAKLLPAMDECTYVALLADIQQHGVRVPIALLDGQIIDGRARYDACVELGITPPFCNVSSGAGGGEASVISLNLLRKHWTEGQRALMAARLSTTSLGSNQQSIGAVTQGEAAKRFAISVDSLQRAQKIIQKGNSDLIQHVEKGDVTLKTGEAAAKSLSNATIKEILKSPAGSNYGKKIAFAVSAAKQRTAEAIANVGLSSERAKAAANTVELPIGESRYGVIYADPPWDYLGKDKAPYPTMSIEEICDMEVNKLAADDAVLFLWIPNSQLRKGLQVIESWGFEYKTNFVWDKQIPGAGVFHDARHELILMATRGKGNGFVVANRPTSLIREKKDSQIHSRKPEEGYVLIESMYPTLSKIELFCRGVPRPGWEGWGNQCLNRPELTADAVGLPKKLAKASKKAKNDAVIAQAA